MNFKIFNKYINFFILILSLYFTVNIYRIYQYSKLNSKENTDIAIVLGAGTNLGKLSPIFKERINHSIKLYHENRINKIIFTGGFGKGQNISDSQVAKNTLL